MKLQQKSILQQNIETIEETIQTTLRAVSSAVHALNLAYKALWELPDDQLTELLQHLLTTGKLEEVFTSHYISAINLNQILDNGEYGGVRAVAVAGREFTIDQFGTVALVVPVVEEVVEPVVKEPVI